MTGLYLLDDERGRTFAPFALTRPVGELRAGAALLRERWERAAGVRAAGFVAGAVLDDFEEGGAPASAREVPAGALLVNSRCAVSLSARLTDDAGVTRWRCGDRSAAIRTAAPLSASALRELSSLEELSAAEGDEATIDGRWIEAPWTFIGTLDAQITDDVLALAPELDVVQPEGAVILGSHPVLIERGATVEPLVCLDATAGPILVRRGATVQAYTRLVGPCVIGAGSTVLGGRVASAAIGERCKVAGEVSHVVFVAYSNKGHDGFVGHSYLGRWVNLGAGTITSNLKNTYGPVSLWTPSGMANTGEQFLGTMFGDHVKTGIGTRLSTGTVLGAGANVFGSNMPPRAVPPFAWGDGEPYALYDLEKFVVVAERMMARRDVALGERARRQLATAHSERWSVVGDER